MQGGYGGGKPAPAPIFNHRKRPRQAMFALPASQSETPTTNRGPDLMPVGGFQGNQSNRSGQYRPQGQKRAYSAQQTYQSQGLAGQPQQNRSGNTSSSMKIGENQQGNWGQQNHMRHNSSTEFGSRPVNHQRTSSYTNSHPSQTRGPQQSSTFTNSGQHQQNSTFTSGGQQYNQTRYPGQQNYLTNTPAGNNQQQGLGYGGNTGDNKHTVGYGNVQNQPNNYGNRHQPNNTPANRNNRQARGAQHNNTGSGFGSKTPYTGGYGAPTMGDQLPAGVLFNQAAQSGNGRSDAQSFGQTSAIDTATRNKPQPKKLAQKNSEKPSLRVLTANLDTVLKSAAFSEQLGPHMFEVFGVLDSAVVSDKSGTGREFVLRDETASLNCVFYEIDRNLPRLIRGQWQRCVGTLDGRSGKLKCVSVRAVRGEERQLVREGQRQTEQVFAGVGRMAHEQ